MIRLVLASSDDAVENFDAGWYYEMFNAIWQAQKGAILVLDLAITQKLTHDLIDNFAVGLTL